MDSPELASPELKEYLQTSGGIERPNSYKTRGKPYELVLDGVPGLWHSVKGGVNPEKRDQKAAPSRANFEVLYNSNTQQWLKVVPPETKQDPEFYKRKVEKLRRSAVIARHALEIAGVPHLADDIIDCTVQLRGQYVDGFVSPHLGPSTEYYLERLTGSRTNSEVTDPVDQEVLSHIYSIAYDQAVELYLRHGEWMADPNPGNIVLYDAPDTDQTHVLLIDFATRTQEVPRGDNTSGRLPPELRPARIAQFRYSYVKQLASAFRNQCDKHHIPFSPNMDRYREKCEASVAT